jgi:hypothetical protein
MHTIMGGTQQFDAQIQHISATSIQVQYTIWDHFGAGRNDATRSLPGLPSMYWLQHNSVNSGQGSTNIANMYKPFIWGITVFRF